MSPRTGRPRIENPKGRQLHIRMHKATEEKLERCAAKMHATKTEVIERGIDLVEKEIEEQEE